MRAAFITEPGGPEVLEIIEVPDPPLPSAGEVRIRVHASGLNRADLLQRKGLYPPPAGYSPNIPGLEFAGEIVELGKEVTGFFPGERVFGITAGEAHAELITIDARLATKVPDRLSITEAAAIPEVFITAHDAVFTQAELQPGETLLVHAVASGVGLAALRLGKAAGARVIGTSRSANKLARCSALGLDHAVNAGGDAGFAGAVSDLTGGCGVDVILDLVGAAYFGENLNSLAPKGRLMLVGLTGGRKAEFDLGLALSKRATIRGTVLRARSVEEKAAAVRAFERQVLPMLADGRLAADVDRVFSFAEIAEAHRYLESNESFGKVVLEWR